MMRGGVVFVMIVFFCASCAGRDFAFEVNGDPLGPHTGPAPLECHIEIVPEGDEGPGFYLRERSVVSERGRGTRVEARGVTQWDIHGYEPDAQLILGSVLSTVAGIVVTPIFGLKRLFTSWEEPMDEARMRQWIHDRYLSSWLFLGYLWAPVDYEVVRRQPWPEERGEAPLPPATGISRVMVSDDQGRPVAIASFSGDLYRPVLTDALLEGSTLSVSASCHGDSTSRLLDLLPWYRKRYALTPEEVAAFKALSPVRRPYLLKISPALRSDFLALDETDWKRFAPRLPLAVVENRLRAEKALGARGDTSVDKKQPPSFHDDLPSLLKGLPRAALNSSVWLFVVGIENYDQSTPIAYSRRSAELFTRVAMKRFGIPPENVFLLTDDGQAKVDGLEGRSFPATAASIQDQLRFLEREVAPGDRIYVYYSGHGLPSLRDDQAPYLLARDQAPDFIHTNPEFRVDAFYGALARSRAHEIVVFMESCFTGLSDGKSVFGGGRAATRLVPKSSAFDEARMVVITAGTQTQFSTMYPEKGHRLFSYFLMRELLKRHDTVGSLYRPLFTQTRRVSRLRGGTHIQEPTIRGNMEISLEP